MSGAIVRSGHKASIAPKARTLFRTPGLGSVPWSRPETPVQARYVSSLQVAGLAGLWHGRFGRHGMSHGEHAVPGAEAWLSYGNRSGVIGDEQGNLSKEFENPIRVS